jgi:hypothetical protein
MNEATQQDGMGDVAASDIPRVQPVKAYYDGEELFFIHTETSDEKIADLLTGVMSSPVLVVPELKEVPEEALSEVYVFTDGIKGDDPLGFQPDVFDSVPGDEGQATEIKTLRGAKEAEQSGEVRIERQDVVINEPSLTWPGGRR